MINFSKRVPSRFCWSRSSETCCALSSPSSINASAMRSPKDLTGGIGLPEDSAQGFQEFRWGGKVPDQAVAGKALEFLDRVPVVRIGRGDQDGFAHAIEGQDAPTLTQVARKSPGQFDVHLIA